MSSPSVLAADLARAAAASVALGAVSAFGDWVWARFIPDGAVVPGVVHGVVFFLLLALVLGRAVGGGRTVRRLLATLPLAGLLLAAGFYPLAHALGYLGALLATWVAMWLALALLLGWARGVDEPARLGRRAHPASTARPHAAETARPLAVGLAVGRGLVAAVGSGLAFWAVSGMWTDPAAHPSYGLRFGYWTLAFLPGLVALLVGRAKMLDTGSPAASVRHPTQRSSSSAGSRLTRRDRRRHRSWP